MLVTTKPMDGNKTIRKRNKKTKKTTVSRGGLDTREFIIQRTLDMINEKGMADFRIDQLSSSLELSPGNITYHFPKKENLCYAMWIKFFMEFKGVEMLMSTLMDVKQAFLVIRSITSLIYRYRGVVIYRGSDMVVLRGDNIGEYSFQKMGERILEIMLSHLRNNDYLSQDHNDEYAMSLIKSNMLINMRFWINKEYLVNQCDKHETIEDRISENSIEILYSLYPCLNEKGREEFANLCKKLL